VKNLPPFQRPVYQRVPSTFSRRDFIIAGVVTGSVALLAACGANPSGGVPSSGPAPSGPTNRPSPTPRRLLGIIPEPALPSPTPTPQPLVLRFAHWETGAAAQALSTLADRFSRSTPRIVVQPEVSAFAEHFDNVRRSFATGTAPDVFVNSGAYFQDFLALKALLDLSDRMSADQFSLTDYWTEPTTQPVDGRQYSLPIWNATEIVVYNRDHFVERKLAEPTADWTWDSFLTTAQQLTVGKPGEVQRWGLLLIDDLQGGWGSFVAGNGGDWLDLAGQKVTLQQPAALEALQWCVDAILVHHVAPRPSQVQRLSQAGQIDPFLAGDVSMFPTGTWEMPLALAQAPFQWDVQRLPRAPRTGESVTLSGVQPASIASATRLPDQSWQFLRFLLERDAQTLLAAGKVKLPSRKDVAVDQTSGYAVPPPAHAVVAAQAMEHARDLHFVPRWQAFRTAVVDALAPAFDGRVLLSDAVQQAVSAGDAALSGTAAD